jgi:hypothetical protein
MQQVVMDWILREGPLFGFSEHTNETVYSIKDAEILNLIRNNLLKDS